MAISRSPATRNDPHRNRRINVLGPRVRRPRKERAKPIEIDYYRPYMYPKQEEAMFHDARVGLVEASTKSGKAQPLDATLWTRQGPISMGDVRVGDEVATLTGYSRVVGVFPQGVQDIYAVGFSDGSVVECTADHLWEVDYQGVRSVRSSAKLMHTNARYLRDFKVSAVTASDQIPAIEPRRFVSFRKSRRAEAQCIKIADPRGVFLTNDYIPTHNTVSALAWIVEEAMMKGGPNRQFWWIAPVGYQSEIAYRRLVQWFAPHPDIAEWKYGNLHLINGAIIVFKTGHVPDHLYGEDVWGAVIDEASRLREDSWYAVRSTLTATRGRVRIIGNVKGRKNWFYRMCRIAQRGRQGHEYHRITAYDAVQAGVLSEDEIEEARLTLPEHIFTELYMAQPSDDIGNPFGLEALRACTIPQLSPRSPVCFGIDLGKYEDWTVIIGLDAEGTVCFEEHFQRPWTTTIERISQIIGRVPTLVDSTGVGDPIVEQLQRDLRYHSVERFVFTRPSRQHIIESLALGIMQTAIRFPEGRIRDELEDFEYEYTPSGIVYQAPADLHDDAVMALALAWEMYNRPKPGGIGGVFL